MTKRVDESLEYLLRKEAADEVMPGGQRGLSPPPPDPAQYFEDLLAHWEPKE